MIKEMIYKNEEIDFINLNESGIVAMAWTGDNETDFETIIDWNGQENLKNKYDFLYIKTKIVFEFVTNLIIQINSKEFMGALEIYDFSYLKRENNTYNITFRFELSQKGSINLDCVGFSFIIY
ncbi:hypothetical protein [Bacteroides nordii]|uniref:hypothetical protein n=1 Tax=Bacteroides nordii TaxID=291645 RepID=UPI002A802E92|nr:hypothetical protein [Bacteroides nordii]